jgi:hypothetical protein
VLTLCIAPAHRAVDAEVRAKVDEDADVGATSAGDDEADPDASHGPGGGAAAQAAAGAGVPPPPPASARASRAAQLIFQGFPLIPRPPPAQAENEFTKLLSQISTCRQSDQAARDLLDKDTYDRIFAARAPTKSPMAAGGATRSAGARGRTRGGGGTRGGDDNEGLVLEHLQSELHSFLNPENGIWSSDWVVQVRSLPLSPSFPFPPSTSLSLSLSSARAISPQ